MKTAIKEYIELTDLEKKALWDRAVFVFDTNVFLNLYRYSKKTRDALLDAMKDLKDQIWMPHQVAYEFMKNRPDVIFESVERYPKLEDNILQLCKDKLRIKDDDPEFKKLQKVVTKWFDDYKNANLLVDNVFDDDILEKLLLLFENKTGEPFSDSDLIKLKKDGEERYKKEIPPGYKDKNKTKGDKDNNAYGDLIVWKQILDYAKLKKKDIVFVTHDQKDDWWNTVHGKTLGPRIELKKEFYDYTEMLFHMYTMDNFISHFETAKDNRSIVDEVRAYNDISQGMHTMLQTLETTYTLSEDDIGYLDLQQIQTLIHELEEKRDRREKELTSLLRKYNEHELPLPVHRIIRNLQKNMRIDEKNIAKLIRKRNFLCHNYFEDDDLRWIKNQP